MRPISKLLFAFFALIPLALASPARAEAEKRIAFVVGEAAYPAGPLATPANDAGLIAQTLQAAGFDVAGARDLDGEALRAAFRDFLDKAQASGPDTVAFVYLSGYGAQLDGENYFAPVDAKIAAAPDVAVEALRVSDYTKRLAGLRLKASFVVLDAARSSPFAKSGEPLAGGLALADAEPDMLIAFNAAPGTVAPSESGPYSAYARALAEMIREGGLSPSQVFDGVRLRVNETTKGAQAPWDASRITAPFVFFERAKDAPPPALAPEKVSAMQSRPLADLGAQDAYAAAIERDTLQGYEEFLAAYPSDPLASRVRALLAARREALTWQRTCHVNTADAYWSYLSRYPRGLHAPGARRRLTTFAAPEEPPPSFVPIVYDVPPPPPPEIIYVDRPVLILNDPAFGFAPPPPIVFLAPPPTYLVFAPPPPPVELFVLPVPVFVPVPVWINPPVYVAPPPGNVIFANIHNTTIINNNTNVINPGAPNLAPAPGLPATAVVGAGVAAAAIAAKVALPPSVARKATMTGGGALPGQPGAMPATGLPHQGALPGANGKPLPGPGGQTVAPSQQTTQPAGQGALRTPAGGPSQNNPPAAHALPSGQQLPPLPGGHPALGATKPGANGKPLPGPGGQTAEPSQQKTQPAGQGALQTPVGGPSQNNPPATHALPSGQELPPSPGGHAVPGVKSAQPTPPPGRQPSNKLPDKQIPPQNEPAPSGPKAKPAVAAPSPIVPRPQQPHAPPQSQQSRPPAYQQPHAPPQFQQSRPQPAFQQPHAPPQFQQSRPQPAFQQPHAPPQFQQSRPQPAYQQPHAPPQFQQSRPQPAFQQPHAPPQFQQSRPQPAFQQPHGPPQFQQSRPQPQQQSRCGQPGLPPCH